MPFPVSFPRGFFSNVLTRKTLIHEYALNESCTLDKVQEIFFTEEFYLYEQWRRIFHSKILVIKCIDVIYDIMECDLFGDRKSDMCAIYYL